MLLGVETKPGGAEFRFFRLGADAFDVCDADFFVAGVEGERARKPAYGNQAEQFAFARLELKTRDGVLRAVGAKKNFPRCVKRQRVGLRAKGIAGRLPRAN